MVDASASAIETALAELIRAYEIAAARPDDDAERRAAYGIAIALARALPKRKDLKTDLAPVAKMLAHDPDPRSWLPGCIAQPADHPLHRAASALLHKGVWQHPVLTSISPRGLPKRWVTALRIARSGDVVYAVEVPASVSVWSLADGTHVEDLAIPGMRGDVTASLIERSDGTLRVITCAFSNLACGLFERAPGEAAFRVLHKPVARSRAVAETTDFAWVLFAPPPTTAGRADPTVSTFWAVDAASGKRRDLALPFQSLINGVPLDDHRLALRVDLAPAQPDEAPRPVLMLVDVAHGTHESFACPEGASTVETTDDPAVVTVAVCDREEYQLDFDTRTRTFGPPRARGADSRDATGVYFAGGRYRYEPRHGDVFDAREHDTRVGRYRPEGGPHGAVAAYDAARDRLVVAGSDPPTPVALVAVYDPVASAVVSSPSAPDVQPLDWARSKTVLSYRIADFDAEDAYTLTLLASRGAALSLAVCMDEDELVADALRFDARALDDGGSFVTFSQGSANVDVGAIVTDRAPPCLLPRSMFAQLVAGTSVKYSSTWVESDQLEPGARDVASVTVDGVARTVAVRRFEGRDVAITVLDDATWPLVIERTEAGNCFVRLEGIVLAAASKKTAKPAAIAGEASTATSSARRFESDEGTTGKFWEVSVADAAVTVRFGKRGTNGQSQTKTLASPDAAAREATKMIGEKTRKGYREVTS